MRAVKKFADAGGLVAGFCNGFQILTEAHILPGALIRNKGLRYICKTVGLETVSTNSPFTNALKPGAVLQIPIAHGEGCYTADEATLDQLVAEDRIVFRYTDNPNGSMRDIAGILSAGRNVMGMMPHPERVSDPLMPGTDGLGVFQSMLNSLAAISR
jgi:phosphoribosylformylglycinamidine synthase I